jgi:hypothetical protein
MQLISALIELQHLLVCLQDFGIMADHPAEIDPNNLAYMEFDDFGPNAALLEELLAIIQPLVPSVSAHMEQGSYWQQRAAGEPVGATPEECEAHMQLQSVYQARAERYIRQGQCTLAALCKAMIMFYVIDCKRGDSSWQMDPQLSHWLRAPIQGPGDVPYARHLLQLIQAGQPLPGAGWGQQVAA